MNDTLVDSEQPRSHSGQKVRPSARVVQDSPPAPLEGASVPEMGSILVAPTPASLMPTPSRYLIFAMLSAVCLLFAVGYVAWAALRSSSALADSSIVSVPVTDPDELPVALRREPHIVFRSALGGSQSSPVALMPVSALDGPRSATALECERVHFSGGAGICLKGDGGLSAGYTAYLFGPNFEPQHSWPLDGYPSRARVSPDGRYVATTVFVAGHSYADGGFSTETLLYDAKSGAKLGSLEQFEIWRDGKRFQAVDFNFWGVTFARDSNRFYATVATGGQTYLIEGDVAARKARVLRENVECPSLSPDNTRVAFKKLVGDRSSGAWRLYVLDLATMEETPLAETRVVDDQVEWLDDRQVLYSYVDIKPRVSFNVWAVPADGSGSPRILVPSASSPAVVR
jgi:hypothetical protein